jgi:ElaB/YqjD/DUF883 family membrane-anchored ribosome-binding protein
METNKLSISEVEELTELAERKHEMLKDKVHDQYDEIQELKNKISKAWEYIEENCGADNRLQLKKILKGE